MLLITVVVAFYEQAGLTLDVLVIGTLFIAFFGVLFVGKRLLHKEDALVRRLAFTAISDVIERTLAASTVVAADSLEVILEHDRNAREVASGLVAA